MRLSLAGDWAAPIVFTMTSIFLFLWLYLATVVHFTFTNEPPVVSQTTSLIIVICAIVAASIALIATISAIRGRQVPDGSTWESTHDVGLDAASIIGSTGLLIIGCFSLAAVISTTPSLRMLVIFLLPLTFFWAAVKLTLGVWLVVLTPNHSVITFRGKPITFTRNTYPAAAFKELKFVYRKALVSGIYAYHPDTIYEVWGLLKKGRPIKLGFEAIEEGTNPVLARQQVQAMVDKIATQLNLQAPLLPNPLPIKHYADAAE